MTAKHPCPDCTCCLECAENRCRLCRGAFCRTKGRKLTFAEQIRLFERINAQGGAPNEDLKEERG